MEPGELLFTIMRKDHMLDPYYCHHEWHEIKPDHQAEFANKEAYLKQTGMIEWQQQNPVSVIDNNAGMSPLGEIFMKVKLLEASLYASLYPNVENSVLTEYSTICKSLFGLLTLDEQADIEFAWGQRSY